MMKERNKTIPAAYLVLRRNNSILWMRRANTGYRDGEYGLPSGHVEKDESAVDALIREAKEEIGIDIGPKDVRFLHCMYRNCEDGPDRTDFFFEVSNWAGEPENRESRKCDDMSWFPEAEPPPGAMEYIKAAIELGKNKVTYSEC
jgi:8-oxo-dGTP diphosphatase